MRSTQASRCLGAAAAGLLLLLLPAGAGAAGADLSAVAGAYAAGGGTIPACEFTSAQLGAALSEAGGDIQQYGSDLLAAIQRALSARASGACDKRSTAPAATVTSSTPGAQPPSRPAPGGAVAPPPGPPAAAKPAIPPASIPLRSVAAPTGSGVPAPIWTLAVAAALLVLCALSWLLVRLRGWDPVWAQAVRHSWQEAGYRWSGAWADFSDWSRLARGSRTPARRRG